MDILKVPSKVLKCYKNIELLFGPAKVFVEAEEFKSSYTELIYCCMVDDNYLNAVKALGFTNPFLDASHNWNIDDTVSKMSTYYMMDNDSTKSWNDLSDAKRKQLIDSMTIWDKATLGNIAIKPMMVFLSAFVNSYRP